jgi:CO/xanthine dehydrogenase Mo-binding subunit
MWYGCGNTALPNPSTIRLGLKPDGRLALHQGGVDIGQGSNTVITQICADALGAPLVPLFYWYRLLWVIAGAVLTAIVYVATDD